MKVRLLRLCLLAYPRRTREADGGYLLDLALDMSDASGVPRQALSLVLGGLSHRLRSGRRGAVVLAAGAVAAVLVVGGLAVSDVGTVDVEVEQCAGC